MANLLQLTPLSVGKKKARKAPVLKRATAGAERVRGKINSFYGQGVDESLKSYQNRGRKETGDPEFSFYTSPRQNSTLSKRKR